MTVNLQRVIGMASTVGRIVGYGLVALGTLSFVTTGSGGLWLALIGWFIAQAARAGQATTAWESSTTASEGGST